MATKRLAAVAPIPMTLRAPLLPPLKEPVGMTVEDVEEDVLVNGIWEELKLERPDLQEHVGKVPVMI